MACSRVNITGPLPLSASNWRKEGPKSLLKTRSEAMPSVLVVSSAMRRGTVRQLVPDVQKIAVASLSGLWTILGLLELWR